MILSPEEKLEILSDSITAARHGHINAVHSSFFVLAGFILCLNNLTELAGTLRSTFAKQQDIEGLTAFDWGVNLYIKLYQQDLSLFNSQHNPLVFAQSIGTVNIGFKPPEPISQLREMLSTAHGSREENIKAALQRYEEILDIGLTGCIYIACEKRDPRFQDIQCPKGLGGIIRDLLPSLQRRVLRREVLPTNLLALRS